MKNCNYILTSITYSPTGFIIEEEIQKVCVPEDSDGTKYRCDGTKSLDEDKLRNLPWAEKEKAKKITRYVYDYNHTYSWVRMICFIFPYKNSV